MNTAQYTANQIACFYINFANKQFVDEGVPEGITNLKLQKILYFAQSASLALYERPLFEEEIEAWKFGPVVPTIYQEYKKFGNAPLKLDECKDDEIDADTTTLLENIWTIFGKFSAAELVNITHNHSPWKDAFYSNKANIVIDKAILSHYYRKYFSSEDV